MKFIISLGLAICLPLLSFAQQAERTIFGNITDVYASYMFSTNIDKMLSHQFAFGIELYDNFDLEFTTSNHRVNGNDIEIYPPFGFGQVEELTLNSRGQSYGLALHYRILPHKTFRPIIGLGYQIGNLKHGEGLLESELSYLSARLGIEYQVLDYLVLSANLNLVDKYSHYDFYGDALSTMSNHFMCLSARFGFYEIK
jgi:hypothetical protein